MDNQTNIPDNEEKDLNQSQPLTSFLQAKQTVYSNNESEDKKNDLSKPILDEDDDFNNTTDDNDTADEGSLQFGDILFEDIPSDEDEIKSDEMSTFNSGEQEEDDVETHSNSGNGKEFDANKLNIVLKALQQMQEQISTIITLLNGTSRNESEKDELQFMESMDNTDVSVTSHDDISALKPIDGRVVEGVFDGRGMVGSDGKNYLVPPNYASKSKLVEGDMLKLTITPKGSFIYKQIGPIERSRLIGSLGFDQTIGEYYATSENRRWNVLKASVTYFKGEPGDEIVLLVPKNAPSRWAAVENIIKKNPFG